MGSSLSNLLYHIVFSTKMRMEFITPELARELYPYIGGIIRDEKGILLNIGGMANHLHLLAKFHPTASVSNMLQQIKGSSSKWINDGRRAPGYFAWQAGYAAFSVSISSVGKIAQYIETQAEHHQKKTFQQELVAFLQAHKIAYDERYIWD